MADRNTPEFYTFDEAILRYIAQDSNLQNTLKIMQIEQEQLLKNRPPDLSEYKMPSMLDHDYFQQCDELTEVQRAKQLFQREVQAQEADKQRFLMHVWKYLRRDLRAGRVTAYTVDKKENLTPINRLKWALLAYKPEQKIFKGAGMEYKNLAFTFTSEITVPAEITAPQAPGRPNYTNRVVQEFERRADKGELMDTWDEEMAHLHQWYNQRCDDEKQHIQLKTVKNKITQAEFNRRKEKASA